MCCAYSVVSNSLQPRGLYPTRLLCPWRFSRQEYWSGLLCPPPGDLPKPGIKPTLPAVQAPSLNHWTARAVPLVPILSFHSINSVFIAEQKFLIFNEVQLSIWQCPWASLVAQLVKNPPAMRETWVQSLDWEDPQEKGKATHSSILAWRILWTV